MNERCQLADLKPGARFFGRCAGMSAPEMLITDMEAGEGSTMAVNLETGRAALYPNSLRLYRQPGNRNWVEAR
jgi:hypothetical protein